jgi:hypothetical protein
MDVDELLSDDFGESLNFGSSNDDKSGNFATGAPK